MGKELCQWSIQAQNHIAPKALNFITGTASEKLWFKDKKLRIII